MPNLSSCLNRMKQIEIDIYRLQALQNQLKKQQKKDLNPQMTRSKALPPKPEEQHTNASDTMLSGFILGMVVGFILLVVVALNTDLKYKIQNTVGNVVGYVMLLVICGIVFAFIGKSRVSSKDAEINNARQAEYESQVKQINEQNHSIAMQNQSKKNCGQLAAKNLAYDIEQIGSYLAQLKELRNEGYKRLGIYPKYQTLPAMCAFIEYLESGRCETLTGANGCYNKFDIDEKYGDVILRLDNISSKLDRIMYQQQEMMATLNEIGESTTRIANICQQNAMSLARANQTLSQQTRSQEVLELYAKQSYELQSFQTDLQIFQMFR